MPASVECRDVAISLSPSTKWLLGIAGFFYAISMHKFAFRDPLSERQSFQAAIELTGVTCSFAAVVLAARRMRRRYPPSAAFMAFVVFGIFAIFSSWRSFSPSLSIVKGALFLLVLATAHFACSAGLGARYLRVICWAYCAILVAGLLIGLVFPSYYPLMSVETYTGRTRFSVFDTFPGILGEDTALFILLQPLIRSKYSYTSLCFLILINVFAGGKTSTGVLLVLLFIRLVFTRYEWRLKAAVHASFVGAISAVCLFLLIQGADSVKGPLGRLEDSFYGTGVISGVATLDGRLDLWHAAIVRLSDASVLGYGFDGSRSFFLTVVDWAGTSHSSYLEELLAAGWVGSTFLLFGFGSVIKSCFLAEPRFRFSALLVISFLLINAIIGDILSIPSDIGMFVLVWLSYQATHPDHFASGPDVGATVRAIAHA